MSRWNNSEFRDNDAEELPGLYCIMKDKEVLYVGQSRNVQRRIAEHWETMQSDLSKTVLTLAFPWGSFIVGDSVIHIKFRYEIKKGEALMAEFRIMHRLRPMGNRRMTA